MTDSSENQIERGRKYASQRGAELVLSSRLGFGVHGTVFICRQKDRPARTAVKVHEREQSYVRERNAYLRLREWGVTLVRGHHVPVLLDYDDALLVIEMAIVTRPYVLDFGGAYLDCPPDYSPELLAEWRRAKEVQFEGRWPEVEVILSELSRLGIHVADVNPGNITFRED